MTVRPEVRPEVLAAQSPEQLLPLLADRLRAPLADPFLPDIVVVPTAGTRDWLIERLGHLLDDGRGEAILTNVQFWFPNEFNLHAIGIERTADDPWAVRRLRWTVLGLLTEHPEWAPGFASARRPLATAQRIAELFDRYSVYRPEMPASWAVGTAADPEQPLRPDKHWQFDLWHEARRRVGPSVGERFIAARGHLTIESAQVALPGRLSVFGLDVMSPAKVSLLAELASLIDLAVYAVFPAPSCIPTLAAADLGDHLRGHVDVSSAVHNPLSRAWARAGLESMALLTHAFSEVGVVEGPTAPSVLGRLQRSIASDEPLGVPAHRRRALDRGDGSVQVHLCHGATRQVEVMRDALLHRLADDDTLHPRDIIVICPDLETYAPLIGPVMGAEFVEPPTDTTPERRLQLPIAIIDKTTSTSTPVADGIAALFDVIGNRLELAKVFELLALEPVRRRFVIDDEGLTIIEQWLTDLRVHWGIDDLHRSAEPWNYPVGVEAGTWRVAVDRLLNGILVQSPEPRETLTGVVAHDDITGTSIDLVGALAAFLDVLTDFAEFCRTPRLATEWADELEHVIVALFDTPFEDRNQIVDALEVARDLRRHGTVGAPDARLAHQEIAALFAGELDGIRARARVWGDVVRVASLSRLRGVPARVVAILGFDDRAFTSGRGNGDDILLDAPRIAERDFHAEERLGLLNLVCAATDALIITCNGFDVTNNDELPLAVPLAELTDAVACVIESVGESSAGTTPVLVGHARQLTDPVNFAIPSPSPAKNVADVVDGPWTFDPVAAVVAQRVLDVADQQPTEITWPDFDWNPNEFDRSSLSIATVVNAIRRPAEHYLRERMQISLPDDQRSTDDQVQLWPGDLDHSLIGMELVRGRLAGTDLAELRRLRELRGGVPIGALGDRFWNTIANEIDTMLATPGVDFSAGTAVPVSIDLDGASIIDTIEATDTQVVEIAFSQAHRRHRTRPWIQLAALAVAQPAIVRTVVVLARPDKKQVERNAKKLAKGEELTHEDLVTVERFALAGATDAERRESALAILRFALEVHRRALCSPIPLFERSSWAEGSSTTKTGRGSGSSEASRDLATDLRNRSARALFGGCDFRSLIDAEDPSNVLHPVDAGLAVSGTRFQAYARALQGRFDETTVGR